MLSLSVKSTLMQSISTKAELVGWKWLLAGAQAEQLLWGG